MSDVAALFSVVAAAQAAPAMAVDGVAAAHLLDAMKWAAEGSSTMVTWALSTIGGSIAAIVSTSYLRPANERIRLIYLLYLPGWMCLGVSIHCGNVLARRHIAAHFVPSPQLQRIADLMNHDYLYQQSLLAIGLGVFGVWLTCFLLWWVFGNWRTDYGD